MVRSVNGQVAHSVKKSIARAFGCRGGRRSWLFADSGFPRRSGTGFCLSGLICFGMNLMWWSTPQSARHFHRLRPVREQIRINHAPPATKPLPLRFHQHCLTYHSTLGGYSPGSRLARRSEAWLSRSTENLPRPRRNTSSRLSQRNSWICAS